MKNSWKIVFLFLTFATTITERSDIPFGYLFNHTNFCTSLGSEAFLEKVSLIKIHRNFFNS
ncbi:hypothetical protein DTQ70_12455 [Runella sp. SP2]|nr:hypothetical protein DTQ70_12455 [Runella sp. SP2]